MPVVKPEQGTTDPRPSVVFVCVKNGGKSQMAAGLMRQLVGDGIRVSSAGTHPGTRINALSAEVLQEAGVDITGEQPKALTDEMVRDVDLVVLLGADVEVEPVDGTPVERWITDEPSDRGIEGIERMRLVRDDIAARARDLAHRLG